MFKKFAKQIFSENSHSRREYLEPVSNPSELNERLYF